MSRRTRWAAPVVCGLVAVAEFWKVLLGRVPLPMDVVDQFPAWAGVPGRLGPRRHGEMGDLITQGYPFHHFTAAAVRHGHLPLWQPHLLAGYPWVGALQWGVFSPLSIPSYAFGASTGWAVSFVVRVALAAIFMTLLCRRLGSAPAPAVVAGIAYGGGGFVLAWSGWPLADVAVWIPAVLLGLDVLRARPDRRVVVLTAFAVAAMVLAGHPQTIMYGGLLAVLFAAYRLIGTAGLRARYAAAVAGAGVLGAALSAVQWVPAVEWLGRLERNPSEVFAYRHPLGAVAGLVSRDVSANPNGAGVALPNGALYLGMLVVIGAVLAVQWRRRDDVAFFGAVALAGGLVAFGVPPFFWAANHLPVLKGVPNGRMVLFPCVALPVLASLGITAAMERRHSWAHWGAAAGAASVLIGLLFWRSNGPAFASSLHGPWSSVVFAVLAAALLTPVALRMLPSRVLPVALVSLAAVDLVTFGSAAFPTVTRDQIFRQPPIITTLKSLNTSDGRVAVVDAALPSNVGVMYGFDTPAGYEYVTRDQARYLDGLGPPGNTFEFTSAGIAGNRDRRLDMLAVRYVITSDYNSSRDALAAQPDRFRQVAAADHTQIFENLRALPRAWFVPASGARSVNGVDAAVAAMRNATFDPTREVVVTGGVSPSSGSAPASVSFRLSDDTVRATVTATEPGIVVVSQQWFPGWTARVDGRKSSVLRVNGILQGVAIGPGRHDIVLRYRPSSFRWAALTSALALVFALLLIVGRRGLEPRSEV